jgi:hypothetical protein
MKLRDNHVSENVFLYETPFQKINEALWNTEGT